MQNDEDGRADSELPHLHSSFQSHPTSQLVTPATIIISKGLPLLFHWQRQKFDLL